MWELVKAGGWLMWPIVLCSILMLIIIIERAIKLKVSTVTPAHLREQLMQRLIEQGDIDRESLENVKLHSPLGDILAAGLMNRQHGIDSMTMQYVGYHRRYRAIVGSSRYGTGDYFILLSHY